MSIDFLINGVAIQTPQELTVGLQTIDADSSGRNANGEMVRDVIAEKVKLTVKWGPLNSVNMANILRNINGTFFPIRYFDPKEGGLVTKTFYSGDRSAAVYSWNEKFQKLMWQNLSVDFIEQ